jgi:hypothetical protein
MDMLGGGGGGGGGLFYRHWVENVDHIYYVETVSDMYLQGVTLDIIFVLQMY